MKVSELKEKGVDGIQAHINDLLKEQFELRMSKSTGQLTQTHRFRQVRRDIARAKTVLKQLQGN